MIKPSAKINKFKDTLEEMRKYFVDLSSKRNDYYDSKSDTWKDGEKGGEVLEEIGNIDDVVLNIEQVESSLEDLYEF